MTPSRLLLIVLTFWGLLMVVPDMLRITQSLGSLGFFANNDGLVYDANGPFPEDALSPAWRAGIRIGDRIDLEKMRCRLSKIEECGSTLAVLGGVDFVLPGRAVTIELMPVEGRPARQLTLIAEQRPYNVLIKAVNMLCQIAAIAVIIAAAWLVWTRPSAMSWGFFLYVNWFNPGQVYAFYAILEQWPLALLIQDAASILAQAAGYAGFLLFVLRVPNNETEPHWHGVERALPLVGLVFALLLFGSYGALFGHPAETVTRASILAGFVVDAAALGILLARRRFQTPEDYQRVRWVIWGCLIGLPSFLIAELASTTTIFETRWGDFTPTEDIIGLLYLVNGVLCLFVFEALRRPRVVSVTIPLRRVTILGLSLSVPVLLAASRGRAHPGASGSTGLGMDRLGRRRRLRTVPPARRRGSPRRRLFQSGGRRGGAKAWASHPCRQAASRDRPAARRRDPRRAEARFRRVVSPARTGLRAGRQWQGLGGSQDDTDQGGRADACPRARRPALPPQG